MDEPIVITQEPPPSGKQRHGCLAVYLTFMIVVNSAMALFFLVGAESIRQNIEDMPEWVIPALFVASVFNLICAVALFQ